MSGIEVLLSLEEERRCAMLAGNTQTLLALLAPDLHYVHSTGVTESRESLLEKLRTRQITYQQLSFDNLAVTLEENAGIVTGDLRAQVQRGEDLRSLKSRYLAVWLRKGHTWRLAAFQSTAVLAPT